MQTSEPVNELFAALAKAQGSISNPHKESENPHFRSRYTDLATGLDAIREHLSANGIAMLQPTYIEGETLMLETLLTHASGQWVTSEYPVAKVGTAPQAMGSALTYARRYSLFSLVGIAGEDDDGNAANDAAKADERGKRIEPTPIQAKGPITAAQAQVLRSVIAGIADTEWEGKLLKALKVSRIDDMDASLYEWAARKAKEKAERVAEKVAAE